MLHFFFKFCKVTVLKRENMSVSTQHDMDICVDTRYDMNMDIGTQHPNFGKN